MCVIFEVIGCLFVLFCFILIQYNIQILFLDVLYLLFNKSHVLLLNYIILIMIIIIIII